MKKLFSTKYSDNGLSFALFVMRLTFGGLIIPKGYQKLIDFAAKSSGFSDPFHIGGPLSMGLVIFAELICGALLVMGLFTRLACIPLIIAMSVVVFYAHDSDVLGKGQSGALFLGAFIALLFSGPGKFSMDRLIGK